jgi:hypothetical protein
MSTDPFICECCGTYDAIAGIGARSLCTTCRQSLDLCTMCAAPALSGEWWCPDCEFSIDAYMGDVLVEVL